MFKSKVLKKGLLSMNLYINFIFFSHIYINMKIKIFVKNLENFKYVKSNLL